VYGSVPLEAWALLPDVVDGEELAVVPAALEDGWAEGVELLLDAVDGDGEGELDWVVVVDSGSTYC
jgi:hypothetical protein